MSVIREIELDKIRIDGGTQVRVEIDQAKIAEYAESLEDLPPVIIFTDGSSNWLGDGFHRYFAYKKAEKATIPAAFRTGTLRDAIRFSLRINSTHGKPLTRDDKRKAIRTILEDPEWRKWSDSDIVKETGFSRPFVAKNRAQIWSEICQAIESNNTNPTCKRLQVDPDSDPKIRKIRTSTGERTMNVSKIGRGSKQESDDLAPWESSPSPEAFEPEEVAEASDPIETESLPVSPAPSQPVDSQLPEPSPEADQPQEEKQPIAPWADFESGIREAMTTLRGVSRRLGELLQYDPDTKQLRCKWAYFYSYAGTVSAINGIARSLEDSLPVQLSEDKPGYLSKQRSEALNAARKAKVA